MKLNSRNIGLLMVTLVATSVGATYLASTVISSDVKVTSTGFSPKILGNVQIKLFDEETGQVKAYRQTDNHIVVSGMTIIAAQVFNDTRSGYSYSPIGDDETPPGERLENFTNTNTYPNGVGTVKWMDIGNGTNVAGWNNVTLHQALHDSKASSGAWPNCDRVLADMRYTNQTKAGPGTKGLGSGDIWSGFAEINVTAIATFDGSNCAAGDIQEAGIWTDDNDTDAGGALPTDHGLMFARNTFLPVSLSTSDSLELTWTFTFTDS